MERLRAAGGKVGRERGTLLIGVHEDTAHIGGEGLFEKLGELIERARAEHDVAGGDVVLDKRAVALGDAAADGDDALSRGRRRHADERGCLAVEALIGVLAHAAGHEDDDVGLLEAAGLVASA